MIYECVINVSNGQDELTLESLANNIGKTCLDVHIDFDHNRSVFTLGGFNLNEVFESAQFLVERCYESFNFENHDGVHPRLGLVDVVPFISYDEETTIPSKETIEASINFGHWASEKYSTQIFFYDYASPEKVTLPYIRKNAIHDSSAYGSMCIGAREPLLAINVNVDSCDLFLATNIAKAIRESSGGIKGVRAIGLKLSSQKKVQVSMNIVNTVDVNAGEVCLEIKRSALPNDCEVELVGLVPMHQYEKWDNEFISWSNIDESFTVESRLSS